MTRDHSAVVDELLRLEQAWMKAVQQHDIAALTQILADEFTLTSWASDGEIPIVDGIFPKFPQWN